VPGIKLGELFRIDLLLNINRLILLEIDENQHRGQSYRCDGARMLAVTSELRAIVPDVRILWLRFNPNGIYRIDGRIVDVSPEQRFDALAELLDVNFLDAAFPEDLHFHYMYYDSSTLPNGCLKADHVVVDEISDEHMREILSVTSAQ
jgi:hypothetical protein